MAAAVADGAGDRGDAARRYPPLLFLVAAVVIAMAVLPSALTLPQSNPSQTVEIAPVPPDDNAPPQQGNTSELSLGSGDSVQGDGAPGGAGAGGGPGGSALDPLAPLPPPIPPVGGGAGKSVRTKRCVQTKDGLRQTGDLISPPCSAEFPADGDNGGDTYQGVSKDEIRILVYAEGGILSSPTPRGSDTSPTSTLIDLDSPPATNEHGEISVLRVWFKYFNERYQLYNRRAHGYVYWSSGTFSQQARQADAAAAFSRVRPFATISTVTFGSPDSYLEYMAQQGVLNFGSTQGRPGQFFRRFPKLIWGFPPSLEQQARVYTDYVCSKVKTSPTGQGTYAGAPRKYGLIYTTDKAFPNLEALKDQVKSGVQACGVTISDELAYEVNGFAIDSMTNPSYATDGMAKFKNENITTILWPGGTEANYSLGAQGLNYLPEWYLAGDGQNDAASYATRQRGQQAWKLATVITPTVRYDSNDSTVCYQEYRSQDPSTTPDADIINNACSVYNDLRQLFTGIQVAGPKLGPTSIDKGYHAIPAVESKDPRVPACFYDAGDYTCVKDAEVMHYDTQGTTANEQMTGCWRMTYDGTRHIVGKFPPGPPANDQNRSGPGRNAQDPCNNYSVNYSIQ